MPIDLKSSRIHGMDSLIAGYEFHATSDGQTFERLVSGFESLEFSMQILECGMLNLLRLCGKQNDPDEAIVTMVRLLLTQVGVMAVQCECYGKHSQELKKRDA